MLDNTYNKKILIIKINLKQYNYIPNVYIWYCKMRKRLVEFPFKLGNYGRNNFHIRIIYIII